MVFQVNRKSRRSLARSERPRSLDGQRLGVKFRKSTLIFDVYEHVALTVQLRLLGLATQGHGPNDFFGFSVDYRGIVRLAIEREYPLGHGIVNDGVRIS